MIMPVFAPLLRPCFAAADEVAAACVADADVGDGELEVGDVEDGEEVGFAELAELIADIPF